MHVYIIYLYILMCKYYKYIHIYYNICHKNCGLILSWRFQLLLYRYKSIYQYLSFCFILFAYIEFSVKGQLHTRQVNTVTTACRDKWTYINNCVKYYQFIFKVWVFATKQTIFNSSQTKTHRLTIR